MSFSSCKIQQTHKVVVITLANHNRHQQSNEPIRTQSKYVELTRSAGKQVQARHDGFTSDWMKEVFFLTNQLLFNTRVKTAPKGFFQLSSYSGNPRGILGEQCLS